MVSVDDKTNVVLAPAAAITATTAAAAAAIIHGPATLLEIYRIDAGCSNSARLWRRRTNHGLNDWTSKKKQTSEDSSVLPDL